MIKEIIVVEGRDDVTAVKRALDCELITTGGFGFPKGVMERIKAAQARRGVIIFTDPDFAGEKIRKKIAAEVPALKCAACEYTLQNRWMLEREERNSNDNNEGGGSNWYPATLLFFVNLSLSKKYREASHSSSPFVKSSYITSVPASTQHLGNVYYSSEPFQARS